MNVKKSISNYLMNIAQIYHYETAWFAILYHAIKPDIDPVKLGRDNIKTSAIECGSHIQLYREIFYVFTYFIIALQYVNALLITLKSLSFNFKKLYLRQLNYLRQNIFIQNLPLKYYIDISISQNIESIFTLCINYLSIYTIYYL